MSGKEERTEAPTPRRKREARHEGRIARSPDVASWLGVLVASFVLPSMLGRISDSVADALRSLRCLPASPEPSDALRAFGAAFRSAMFATLPLLAVVSATALVATAAQVGFVFTAKPLKPKFNRLNPTAGFRQLLSVTSLWDTGKSLLRIVVLALVTVPAVGGTARMLLARGTMDLSDGLSLLASRSLTLVRTAAALALVLAAADYVFQRRRIGGQLRMTKQEIKQEHRNAEGDPHVKARLRSLRRRFSQNRMIAGASGADVVLVNPTHVAVAVKYDRAVGVPTVVARGSGALAARIREIAREGSVPIVEEKPLARALYHACDAGDAIPRELFEAVAHVLAFVYSLGARSFGTDVLRLPQPLAPIAALPARDRRPAPSTRPRATGEIR